MVDQELVDKGRSLLGVVQREQIEDFADKLRYIITHSSDKLDFVINAWHEPAMMYLWGCLQEKLDERDFCKVAQGYYGSGYHEPAKRPYVTFDISDYVEFTDGRVRIPR